MRTYPDPLSFSLRQQLGNIQLAAHRAQEQLKQRWLRATWRLNEAEAQHPAISRHLDNYDQYLLRPYGQRLNAGYADPAEALAVEHTEHHGKPGSQYGYYNNGRVVAYQE